jgi:hypothetical protein
LTKWSQFLTKSIITALPNVKWAIRVGVKLRVRVRARGRVGARARARVRVNLPNVKWMVVPRGSSCPKTSRPASLKTNAVFSGKSQD